MYQRDANLGLERAVGPLWKARRVPMESEMCPSCTFVTEHGGCLGWDLTIQAVERMGLTWRDPRRTRNHEVTCHSSTSLLLAIQLFVGTSSWAYHCFAR